MDADFKEIGFIMTFALLIGFGYFNVSFDDLAFTQPAPHFRYLTAESLDVPAPITVQGFTMLNGIPLSTVTLLFEPVEPQEINHFSWLVPTAEATKITTQSGLEGTLSVGGTAQATCGNSHNFGGISTNVVLNRASASTQGCIVSILLLSPVPPHELGPFITQAGLGLIKISGQINHSCGLVRNDGIPTQFGGTQSALEAHTNATGNPFLGGNLNCQQVFVGRQGLSTGIASLGTDFGNRLIAGVNPDGSDIEDGYPMLYTWNGYPNRAGVNRFFTITSGSMFEHYSVDIPVNNTDGIWQFKEHSKYDSGLMTDCNLNRVGDVLRLDSGSLDSHQGQCIMFKVFNKTAVGTPDVSADVIATGTGSSEMRVFVDVKDGIYDMETAYNNVATEIPMVPNANNQWTENQLEDDLGSGTNHRFGISERNSPFTGTIDLSPAYSLGSEDFFTVFVGIQDNSTDGSVTLDISNIKVGTNEYDFDKPDVRFYEHTITTVNSNQLLPELDVGFIDGNFTVGAGVTAPALPTPSGLVETLNATAIASILLEWTHDGANTTGYRVYRTSTEAVDEVIEYSFSGTLNPQALVISQSPRDFGVESTWPTAQFRDEIISRITINKMDGFGTPTGGDVQGVIVANTIGTDDTIIANSTTKIDPANLPVFGPPFDGSAQTFRFRDTNLVNLTTANMPSTTNAGFGVVWNNPGSGSVVVQTRDRGDGSSPRALRLDVGSGWAGVGGQDVLATIASINQTKLFAPAIPLISDTGSLDTNVTDFTTLVGHTYFYRVVPLNGLVEGNTIGIANATEPEIPQQVTGLTGFFNETSQAVEITWDDIGANSYRVFRASTEDTTSFLNTGLSGTAGLALSQSPRDHISQNTFTSNGLTGKIITDAQFRCSNLASATGGFLQGAIFVASQTGQTTDATLANSSNSFTPESISASDQNCPVLKFRDDGLINHTTSGLRGIGLSWINPTSGSFGGAMSDTLTGGSEQSRWDGASWARTNGFDLHLIINQLNQTKLSDTFSQTSATTLSDSNVDETDVGNTYFYRIAGLNILSQEGALSDIINVTALNVTAAIPGQVQNLTLSHDNVNTEIDLTWDVTPDADTYTVQRLSTERQIVESNSFGGESNFVNGVTGTNDIGGDDSGFDTFDIPTQVELRVARFGGLNPNNGQIVYGQWINVISNGVNQVEPDLKSEVEQAGYMISAGTRPNRDCNKVQTSVEQDGWTQRSSGFWYDGNCQVENRFLGTQIRNLTVAETANAEVTGAWRNMTSGGFLVLRPFAGGGSGWVFQDTAPNKWFSSVGMEQLSYSMNQTWVNVTQVVTNSFNDTSTNNYNTYLYRVIAENTLSQEGAPSSVVNGTLSLPPLRVTDLNGTDNGGTVDLTWEEASIKFSRELSEDPVQGYIIQRATGENETTIYDGIGNAGEVFSADHDVEEFFLDFNGLTLITNPKSSSDRTHAGQQLNITTPINVTRIVAKVGCNGGCGNFNVEPDLTATIHFENGTFITRSINPRLAMGADMGDAPGDKGFVNWVFSPPVQLEVGEYIFGWQQRGVQSCNSANCGDVVNRSFKVFFEETGIGGGSSGWAIGADNTGLFTNNPLNGTKAHDMAMAIFAETTWETIGTNLGATNTTFTDNSSPNGTFAYRVLAFNDAGTSHPPTLMHNPQNTTIMKMGNAFDFFPQDAQGRQTAGGPIGALNYGSMITFSPTAPIGTVPNAPTGLDATADGVNINLDWDDQGTADSFSVFRNGSSIATGVILSEFTDLAVAIGEFFSYTVTAVNVNGSSPASTPSIVLSNDVPSVVSGAGTMPINGVAVLVEWDDPVADRGEGSPSTGLIVNYTIFRSDTTVGGPFVNVATVQEGTNFLNDTSVLGGHSFIYKILSANEIGNAVANSTVTAPVMVDNALVIRALENDGIDSLEEDARITIFNSTFNSGPLQANAQGRVFLFNASGAYNFTIFYTAQNIDFLVNKTLTGVSGVILTEDTVVNVNTNVFKVDCASNGPAKDFKVLVNSTSDVHFISNFTAPVCDSEDKVSWEVLYEGLGTGGGGTGGSLNGVDNSTSPNLGTFGTNATGKYFIPNTNTTSIDLVVNASGRINEAVFQDGDVDGTNRAEIRFGEPVDKSQWNFFHQANVGSNLTSVNFWINGDVSGGADYPMLDTFELDEPGDSNGDGMNIFTANGDTFLAISNNDTLSYNQDQISNEPADDGQWHMVTVIYDKGNLTNAGGDYGKICIDSSCGTIQANAALLPISNDANSTLTVGSRHDPFGNIVENKFSVDDLTVWNGYLLTQSDINTMYNSGNGSSAGASGSAVQTSFQVLHHTFDLSGGGGGGGAGTSNFTTTMATQVLSLGDFGNNAKNFVVNGTMLNTTFSTPVITSEAIVVSTNSSDVLLVFEELFLQEEETTPPGNTPGSPPPTQTAGGGGLPRLDITTQLQFFEDLFGFSLFSKIHQMQVGQTQDGTIDITWNSPSPITITGIQVGDQFITWVGFPKTPFTIQGNDRISTGKIPYRIMPPNNLCDEVTGQTANCVDRILYEIPVKIHASVEGQPIEANTVIKVNLSLDITLALFTVFIAFVAGVGAIVYRAAIINPRHNRRAKKELKTRSKDRQQIENRFSARKSKLRRRP